MMRFAADAASVRRPAAIGDLLSRRTIIPNASGAIIKVSNR
jgi:hypothetical protein